LTLAEHPLMTGVRKSWDNEVADDIGLDLTMLEVAPVVEATSLRFRDGRRRLAAH
jgi:hypothetical protein